MGDFPRRLRVRTFAPKEAAARATALLAEVRKVAVVCKDGMSKERQSRAFGFLRVPPEAIAIALELAEGDPGSFPHFDVQLARLALIYGKEMGAVAQLCRAVAARIEEDMTQLHAGAAEETLAVNASAKPWSRVGKGKSSTQQIARLGRLLRTRTKGGSAKQEASAPEGEAGAEGQPTGKKGKKG